MLTMLWTAGVLGQEEGFISHVAQNIQAARDPFLQAQQMAELESVFAFGEKFSFDDKQIDLNEFYGSADSKEDKTDNVDIDAKSRSSERETLPEQTERSGLKGWFDSFDFGNRDFYNSRHQPQSPNYVKATTAKNLEKETYDKEVKNESRRRVFANFRSSTVKPEHASIKSVKTETRPLSRVPTWKTASRKPALRNEESAVKHGG